MSRVLLIAGDSFVGSYLHALLERRRHEVIATTRSGLGPHCDVTDADEVAGVVAAISPDWIINCAGVTNGGDVEWLKRVHVNGAANLLRAVARHAPEATVMLFGSAAEYGDVAATALPIREDQPCRPRSPYGRSKLAQTQVARALAARHRLRVLIARPFNIVGPGLPAHFMPAALAARIKERNPTRKRGSMSSLADVSASDIPVANAHATRDWIDVRDVATALAALLERDVATPGRAGIYNIATGVETPVLALAAELCRLAGGCRAVAGRASGGIERSAGDTTRLRRATGWTPRISWQRSVADLWHGPVQFPVEIS